ncbi:unnamed protein product [Blepharisma stoltei]|uniref:Uncharacterized protein n=1 Tax=Blepharisma stoltei TaxID=1481888 RepID=A0AAU9JR89_9CILI|nr:unnamed protein product [Blepharisma stoltei]
MLKIHQISLAIVIAEYIAICFSNFEPWDNNYIYLYCSLLASGHIWFMIGRLNMSRTNSKFDSDWFKQDSSLLENKHEEWFPLEPV